MEKYRAYKRKDALQNAKLSGCFDGGKPAGSRFFMPCVRKKQLQVIQIPEYLACKKNW